MVQPDDITRALRAFDGVHVETLKALLGENMSDAALDTIVAAIPGPDEIGATWLLKGLAERGRIGTARLATAFERLGDVTEPDAALHLMQIARHAPDAAPLLRPFLHLFYGHSRILLRVWAFDAYCRGAPDDEDLTSRIQQGLRSRHGSMRARSKALAHEFGVDLENGA